MSPRRGLSAELPDDASTRALGAALAAELHEGDVLALCGPLGAGKTTLAQGLARGLGVPPSVAVRSPTFTLCNELAGRLPLLHLDLYRLGGEDEAEDLGFRDRIGAEGVALVEWADRFPTLLPEHAVWILLEHAGAGRRVSIWEAEGADPAWIRDLPGPAEGGEGWTEPTARPPWGSSS